jgi:hypothetical protein
LKPKLVQKAFRFGRPEWFKALIREGRSGM